MVAVDRASERYSLAARLLHWLVALMVVAMIAVGFAMTRGAWSLETTFALYQWHKASGLLVGVAMVARLIVRWQNSPPPLPANLSSRTAHLAKAVHGLLYACLIGLPVLGWLATSAASLQLPMMLFGVIEIPPLSLLASLPQARRAAWYSWLAAAHGWLALIVACLVVLHISGAVRYGRLVLRRMSMWP
jgi:cytochrome b561